MSPPRVIVVDHRPLVREMLGRRLARAGVEVVPVDGERPDPVDVVLVGRPEVAPAGAGRQVLHFTDQASIDGLAAAILAARAPEPGAARPGALRGARLTPREQQVLGAVADGLRAEQVATALGITRASVENHKQRIFGKLGVHSQVEAVSVARRSGQLSRPDDRG